MKKVILGVAIMGSLTLAGCTSQNNEHNSLDSTTIESSTSMESDSINISEKNNFGLTNEQMSNFDDFNKSVKNTIHDLESLNNRIKSSTVVGIDDLSYLLVDVQDIEGNYLTLGGQNQNDIVTTLQENPLGFYQIAKNMIDNNREYTLTEAQGSLNQMTSITKEIATSNNLNSEQSRTLILYFLDNLSPKGTFLLARDNLANEFK